MGIFNKKYPKIITNTEFSHREDTFTITGDYLVVRTQSRNARIPISSIDTVIVDVDAVHEDTSSIALVGCGVYLLSLIHI